MKMFTKPAMTMSVIAIGLIMASVAEARSPHCHRHLGRRAGVIHRPAVSPVSYAYTTPQVAYYRAPLQSQAVVSGYGYSRYSGVGYTGNGYARAAYPAYSGLGYTSGYRNPYNGYQHGGYGYGGYGYGNYGYGNSVNNLYRGYGYGMGSSLYGPSIGIPGTGLRLGF